VKTTSAAFMSEASRRSSSRGAFMNAGELIHAVIDDPRGFQALQQR
jgi:hypothetical protein